PSQQLARHRAALIWGTLIAGRLAGAELVTVSGELMRRLRRLLGSRRVVHIPNPMPPPRPDGQAPDLRRRFGWDAAQSLVGFVGRLEHVKGPDIFVQIAAGCQTDAAFVFAGDGSLAGEVAKRVTAAGLAKRVVFLGEVPDATPYIRQFDVLAIPSRHEGLPL